MFIFRNTRDHLTEMALKHMPSAFQNLDKQKSMAVPNLNTFIFFKVKEDVNDVSVNSQTFNSLILISILSNHLLRSVCSLIMPDFWSQLIKSGLNHILS